LNSIDSDIVFMENNVMQSIALSRILNFYDLMRRWIITDKWN